MDEASVKELIRVRIRAGKLPAGGGYHLFGGRGAGSLCCCCDRIISSAELEFEVECPVGAGTFAMHLHCFDLWRNVSLGLPEADRAVVGFGENGGPSSGHPTAA